MSQKYPLEPLARVRESRAEVAVRALADAVRAREGAEERRRAAEDARARGEAAAEDGRTAERAALDRSQLSAADLARRDAWEHRIAGELRALDEQVVRARDGVAEAKRAEEAARAEVTRREADADVVDKDRARWRAGEERR